MRAAGAPLPVSAGGASASVRVAGPGVSGPPRGSRAESLSRISNATMIQFVTTDEPPCARNGIAIPVRGIRPITPPAMTKTWSARIEASPVASSRPNGSRRASPER